MSPRANGPFGMARLVRRSPYVGWPGGAIVGRSVMADEADPTAANAAADELFAVAPDEFVTRREELVADLRAAGDREAAAEIQKFRRPPRSAWALNVVARQRPELVDAVLGRARAVTDALATGSDGVRDELAAYRAATEAVLDAAEESTGTGGAEWRDRMRATVQAAGDDDALAELLRAGRIVADHAAPGLGGGAAASTIAARRPREARAAPARTARTSAGRADAAAAAEAAEAAAAEAAERARREAERARVAKERARLIRELDRARGRADRLDLAARDARTAADEAARAAEEIEARLRELAG